MKATFKSGQARKTKDISIKERIYAVLDDEARRPEDNAFARRLCAEDMRKVVASAFPLSGGSKERELLVLDQKARSLYPSKIVYSERGGVLVTRGGMRSYQGTDTSMPQRLLKRLRLEPYKQACLVPQIASSDTLLA